VRQRQREREREREIRGVMESELIGVYRCDIDEFAGRRLHQTVVDLLRGHGIEI